MDFGLSEVQQMIKTSARDFLSKECSPRTVRSIESHDTKLSDNLWEKAIEMGWLGLAFPYRYGGSEGGLLDLGVLLEEMGRSLWSGSFFPTVVLGGLTVLENGTEEQKDNIIPGITSGELLMTLALIESDAIYSPSGLKTQASLNNGKYIVNGTKIFVADAQKADIMLLVARTNNYDPRNPTDGITVFLVPTDSPGIEVIPLRTIGLDEQYIVTLNNVSIPVANTLGRVDMGWSIVMQTLDRAAACQSSQMLGSAEAVLDMTLEYVKHRTQFGRPIGTFQAIQHHCANMAINIECGRHLTYNAVWKIEERLPARVEASMAKAWMGKAFSDICAVSHQCHGAIGFTQEHDLQLYTRQAKSQETTFGDSSIHRQAIRDLLGV